MIGRPNPGQPSGDPNIGYRDGEGPARPAARPVTTDEIVTGHRRRSRQEHQASTSSGVRGLVGKLYHLIVG